MKHIVMTVEQLGSLLAEIEANAERARREGYEAGRAAEAEHREEVEADAYEQGYDDGKDRGYDQGYNDGAADSYDDGYEDGRAEAELRAAESAAFDEQPRVHEWVEGQRFFD